MEWAEVWTWLKDNWVAIVIVAGIVLLIAQSKYKTYRKKKEATQIKTQLQLAKEAPIPPVYDYNNMEFDERARMQQLTQIRDSIKSQLETKKGYYKRAKIDYANLVDVEKRLRAEIETLQQQLEIYNKQVGG